MEPTDQYYIPILPATPESDPILALWQRIHLAESESVNLLTGFRGNGKSTELRRLKAMLEKVGCQVYLVNMLDYVLMTKPQTPLNSFVAWERRRQKSMPAWSRCFPARPPTSVFHNCTSFIPSRLI